jgi:cytochrome c oxidase assembly protein subunit 11
MAGMAYASVPLYKLFCRATGFGGTVRTALDTELTPLEDLVRVDAHHDIVVRFNADVSANVPWRFRPCQRMVRLKPGEPALAFFSVENLGSEPIVGVSFE